MTSWIKDCNMCNAGVCKEIIKLKEQGLSERAASRQMEQECDGDFKANTILSRFKYHAKQQYGGGGRNPITRYLSKAAINSGVPERILNQYEHLNRALIECGDDDEPFGDWSVYFFAQMQADRALCHYKGLPEPYPYAIDRQQTDVE